MQESTNTVSERHPFYTVSCFLSSFEQFSWFFLNSSEHFLCWDYTGLCVNFLCIVDFVYVVCVFSVCFVFCYSQCMCVYVCAYLSVPSEVCSQLWVGVSQTAKRPAGIFPISPWCSVHCRLTTEGSEIHKHSSTAFFSLSLSVSLSFSLSFSLC